MTQRIQRPPTGLLGLLGSKGTGINPSELEDRVQPTVDLTPFYQSQDIQTAIASGTPVTAAGAGASLVVPNGEYWQLLAVGGLWSAFTAASVFAAALQIGFLPNLVPVYMMESRFTISAGATDQFRLAWTPGTHTILSPGMVINTSLLIDMAAAGTPQVRALYLKLQ